MMNLHSRIPSKLIHAGEVLSNAACYFQHSGTQPYGHLVNTVTLLLQPLFLSLPAKHPWIHFLIKKPVKWLHSEIPTCVYNFIILYFIFYNFNFTLFIWPLKPVMV